MNLSGGCIISTPTSLQVRSGITDTAVFFVNGNNATPFSYFTGNTAIGSTTDLNARLGIKGFGATSSTTALLVQNSQSTASLQLTDDGVIKFFDTTAAAVGSTYTTFIPKYSSNNMALGFYEGSSPVLRLVIYRDNGNNVYLTTSGGNALTASPTTATFPGTLNVTSALTASNAIISGNVTVLGTASISTLIVNQIGYSSGSNQLGDAADDTQTLYGTVRIPTGSLIVTGSTSITGSLIQVGSSAFSGGTYSFVAAGAGDGGIRIDTTINGYTSFNWLSNTVGLGLMAGGGLFAKVSNNAGFHVGNSPSNTFVAALAVTGHGTTTSPTFVARNSAGTNILRVVDSGLVGINNAAPSASLHVVGNTILSGSAGTGSALTVYKSGSTVMSIQGSQGELFSITDSLSGSLFSVSNISGLPILEVFSDNTVLLGSYLDPMLITTQRLTANSGSTVIYSLPTASYDGVFVDYVIRSGSNARAGQFMGMWSGSSTNVVDSSTTDFGDTSGFVLALVVSGSNMVITGSASTSAWTVRAGIRSI